MNRMLASALLAATLFTALLPSRTLWPFGADAAFAQSSVTLENLAFKGDKGSVSVPKVMVEGTNATKAEIEALFDGQSNETLAQRLSRISAASITIPAIVISQTLPEATSVTTYKDLVLRNISNGVVAEVFAPSMTSNAKRRAGNKDFPEFEVTGERMTLKGLDMALILRVLFNAAEPGETLKVAVAEQSIGKTLYKFGDRGAFSTGEISIRDFKLRPLATPLTSLMGSAENLAKDKSEEGQKRALATMLDLFGSFAIGDFEAVNMAGDFREPGKPPVQISIGRLAGGGGAEMPGRFRMRDFRLKNQADSLAFGEITLEGISIASMTQALTRLANRTDLDPTDLDSLALLPKISLIRFGGIDLDIADTRDPKQRVRAKIAGFETRMGNHVGPIPADVAVSLDGFRMDIPADTKDAGLRDILRMGYSAIDLSAGYEQVWEQAASKLRINDLSLRLAGMFAARANAQVSNATKELFTADQAVAAVAILGLTANSLSVDFRNEGLVDKLIARQAQEGKMKPEDVRAQFAAAATLMAPMLLGDHPAAKTLGAVLGKFVADPRTLTVTLKVQGDGLGATDFIAVSNPMDLLKKIDITATANE
ncbi:MAG: hypothetical protein IOD03_10070 [Methylocystis sp.]|nr:hypothetical protein [Methylocystis sp.]MCA3584025.1 hypothetical protein [Methylocystis sp.]MCA3591639.1 hypothetical protein [Methylocystis sp.]